MYRLRASIREGSMKHDQLIISHGISIIAPALSQNGHALTQSQIHTSTKQLRRNIAAALCRHIIAESCWVLAQSKT